MNARAILNYLFLILGIAVLAVGTWTIVQPAASPVIQAWDTAHTFFTDNPRGFYIGLLAAIVLVGHIARILLRSADTDTKRQPLDGGVHIGAQTTASQPPTALGYRLNSAKKDMTGQSWEYSQADPEDTANAFGSIKTDTRRLITFGWKARTHLDDAPEATIDTIDDLRTLVISTMTTANAEMDHDDATDAINTGTWTDDHIAAAFLAADRDDAPRFTLFERISAWVFPTRAFDRRVTRTLDAIDEQCGVFLTHSPRNTETDSK